MIASFTGWELLLDEVSGASMINLRRNPAHGGKSLKRSGTEPGDDGIFAPAMNKRLVDQCAGQGAVSSSCGRGCVPIKSTAKSLRENSAAMWSRSAFGEQAKDYGSRVLRASLPRLQRESSGFAVRRPNETRTRRRRCADRRSNSASHAGS